MRRQNFYMKKNKMNNFPPKKKHRLFFILIFLFSLFIFSLVFFYYKELPFMGNAIKSFDESKFIFIEAEFDTFPLISSKGIYNLIKIDSNNIFLSIDKKDFDLTNSASNLIELTNFSGTIDFNDKGFELLKGRSPKIFLNGVLVSESKKTRIYSVSNFDYSYLKIEDNFYLKNLNYVTSGVLNFEGDLNSIILKGDEILIKDFIGTLEIRDSKLFLKGYVRSINIDGRHKISISR